MRKILIIASLIALCLSSNPSYTHAEVSGLTPCKDSKAFNQRLKNSVKKLENRLAKYDPSTPPALALEAQITKTKTRFDNMEEQACYVEVMACHI